MDFINLFFVDPFVALVSGIADATGADGVVSAIDGFIWGPIMILLLLGTHLYMTVRTGFIQRKIPLGIKMSLKGEGGAGDVSPFQALTTSLAATLGTGNIIGVGTALIAGGPGAIFWMWITGVFGIATKYSESFIAVKYRVKDHNGFMLGGAMYALERGLKHKKLGKVLGCMFALFATLATFGIGSGVQANSVVAALKDLIGENPLTTTEVPLFGLTSTPLQLGLGIIIFVSVAVVILGGIRSISRVCERFIPLMTLLYVAGCIILIVMNAPFVLDSIGLIVTCAFSPKAAMGGAFGSAVLVALQKGCARGLFSNESGMGSAPMIAAAAKSKNPANQALVSMTATFWDTVVVCAITGIALVSSILANPDIMALYTQTGDLTSSMLVTTCFNQIPLVGSVVLCLGLAMFAYSTMLGWSYYGDRCMTYLFGKNAIMPYRIVFTFICFLGAVGVTGVVWDLSDIANALMAFPNLIAVLALSGVIARETRHYVYNGHLGDESTDEIPVIETK